ncbi:MAG: hypothetical protein H7829_15210, partial [Magnetococcus sp. THC-1_WYH]
NQKQSQKQSQNPGGNPPDPFFLLIIYLSEVFGRANFKCGRPGEISAFSIINVDKRGTMRSFLEKIIMTMTASPLDRRILGESSE